MFFRKKRSAEQLGDRRLIASINSGRSGSAYLARLLGTGVRVKSFHEAEPPMTEKYLEMVTVAPYAASFEERKIKVEAIKELLRGMRPEQIYADSNHMFIKTFFDVVLDAFKNVDVIVLRRELSAVLKSFIELNYFTDKNPNSARWMSSPNAVTAALQPLGRDEELDQFDLSIAYLLDIEARSQRFVGEYPTVPVHQVRVEELNDRTVVDRLFSQLRITPTERTWELIGRPANLKVERKEKFQNPTTLEYCRQRIEQYLARAEYAGIKVPETIAFERTSQLGGPA